jgi:hypothetical protein
MICYIMELIRTGELMLKDNQFELFEDGLVDWEKHSSNNKVIFVDAWNSTKDQLINVRNAVIGGSHYYYCYLCEGRVFAKKGNGKRRPHFAHYHNSSECIRKGESVLHILGKKIISDSRCINVPSYSLSTSEDSHRVNHQKIEYQSTEIEKFTDGIVPDIKLKTGEEEIFVEIVVTHGISAQKYEKIHATGKRVLEISLSKYKDREICIEKIRRMVLEDVNNKRWVHKKNIELGKFIEKELLELKEVKLQIFKVFKSNSSENEEFENYKFDAVKRFEHFAPSFDAFELGSDQRKVVLIVQYENDPDSEKVMYNVLDSHLCYRGDVHLIDLSEIGNDNIINFGLQQLDKVSEFLINELKSKSCLFPKGRSIFELWHQYEQKSMILYSEINLCFIWIRKAGFYRHKLMPSILYCKGRVLGIENFKSNIDIEKQFGVVDGMISHADNPDWVFYKFPKDRPTIIKSVSNFLIKGKN